MCSLGVGLFCALKRIDKTRYDGAKTPAITQQVERGISQIARSRIKKGEKKSRPLGAVE
jgi:hypothetical protein